MALHAIRQLLYAFMCLAAGLLVCIIIKPHGLIANSGISYYGTFASTLLPYAVACLGAAWFFSRTARLLPSDAASLLKPSLIACSIVIIGIVLTPYSFGTVFDWAHTTLGSILFAGQLLLTGYLLVKQWPQRLLAIVWLLELAAGIMCACYVSSPKGYLLEFQIIFQLLFLLCMTVYLIGRQH